jgi:hypothetical protein
MSVKRMLTCEVLWRAGYRPRDAKGLCGCCISCHEDANMGYATLLDGVFKGRSYEVCCRMNETLKALDRHKCRYEA